MQEVSNLSRQVIERGPLSGLPWRHVLKPLADMVICGQGPIPIASSLALAVTLVSLVPI